MILVCRESEGTADEDHERDRHPGEDCNPRYRRHAKDKDQVVRRSFESRPVMKRPSPGSPARLP